MVCIRRFAALVADYCCEPLSMATDSKDRLLVVSHMFPNLATATRKANQK